MRIDAQQRENNNGPFTIPFVVGASRDSSQVCSGLIEGSTSNVLKFEKIVVLVLTLGWIQ